MKLKWTLRASRNLDNIERYIEQDKPRAAIKTVLEITRQVKKLADHPGLGRQGRVDGTRELVITGLPYIVPYSVKGDTVIILRVMHSAMKWPVSF